MGRLGCNVPSASSSVSPKDVYEKWGHRRDGLQKELGQGGGGSTLHPAGAPEVRGCSLVKTAGGGRVCGL